MVSVDLKLTNSWYHFDAEESPSRIPDLHSQGFSHYHWLFFNAQQMLQTIPVPNLTSSFPSQTVLPAVSPIISDGSLILTAAWVKALEIFHFSLITNLHS